MAATIISVTRNTKICTLPIAKGRETTTRGVRVTGQEWRQQQWGQEGRWWQQQPINKLIIKKQPSNNNNNSQTVDRQLKLWVKMKKEATKIKETATITTTTTILHPSTATKDKDNTSTTTTTIYRPSIAKKHSPFLYLLLQWEWQV